MNFEILKITCGDYYASLEVAVNDEYGTPEAIYDSTKTGVFGFDQTRLSIAPRGSRWWVNLDCELISKGGKYKIMDQEFSYRLARFEFDQVTFIGIELVDDAN